MTSDNVDAVVRRYMKMRRTRIYRLVLKPLKIKTKWQEPKTQ